MIIPVPNLKKGQLMALDELRSHEGMTIIKGCIERGVQEMNVKLMNFSFDKRTPNEVRNFERLQDQANTLKEFLNFIDLCVNINADTKEVTFDPYESLKTRQNPKSES